MDEERHRVFGRSPEREALVSKRLDLTLDRANLLGAIGRMIYTSEQIRPIP